MATSAKEARSLVEKCYKAMQDGDWHALEEYYDPKATQEWPQSGERIRGRDNIMAINMKYPSPPQGKVRDVHASGNLVVGEVELDYPEGGKFMAVSIIELSRGKVMKQTDYFAQPFEAPDWRAEFVELM